MQVPKEENGTDQELMCISNCRDVNIQVTAVNRELWGKGQHPFEWMHFLKIKLLMEEKKKSTRKAVSPNAQELGWCTVLATEERMVNTLHEIRTGIYIQELF